MKYGATRRDRRVVKSIELRKAAVVSVDDRLTDAGASLAYTRAPEPDAITFLMKSSLMPSLAA